MRPRLVLLLPLVAAAACSSPAGPPGDGGAGPDLAGPGCAYVPLPPLANSGGQVEAGALQAGAAEVILDLPVSSALGGFSARAVPYADYSNVDRRTVEYPGSFNPSVGIETRPRVKAVALTAGGETVVLLSADLILADAAVTAEVSQRLGKEFSGKVLFATTHTHSSFAQYSTNHVLQLGLGRLREASFRRLVDRLVDGAKQALGARQPARLGIAVERQFDPMDLVSYDRRGEDDKLPGGRRKDDFLAVIRVDAKDGTPIAVIDVFGIHGTVIDADSPIASTDAPGAIERAVEESFDRRVVAMHLQGSAGSVSPQGKGGIVKTACRDGRCIPTETTCKEDRDCAFIDIAHYDFARSESVGRAAVAQILPLWQRAGSEMKSELAIEMVTRAVPLGPDPATFTIRQGRGAPIAYAPWDVERPADRKIFGADGAILSPIDEFNAPGGAGLCGDRRGFLFPGSELNNVDELVPYSTCMRVDISGRYFQGFFRLAPFPTPVCASTSTILSSLRLGEYLLVTLPGEPTVLEGDLVRKLSPLPPERTIVVGYAQGHVGYLLPADDWLQGGYEASINLWGPLEGEYLAERAAALAKLAVTPQREESTAGGAPRYEPTFDRDDDLGPVDEAKQAGQVPAKVPELVYFRSRYKPAQAQPESSIQRLSGVARYVWIGEDPRAGTPRVTVEREGPNGQFASVTRRSGRPVHDGDLLLTWTPDPLYRKLGTPRTHYWAVEWQALLPSGAKEDTGLEERPSLPLGRYRFHVEGTGYRLDSQPFTVAAGPLAVAAKVGPAAIDLEVAYFAPRGFRLLDPTLPSNDRVPLRKGPFTVEVTYQDGKSDKRDLAPTAPGKASFDLAPGSKVAKVQVSDRFGNRGVVVP